MTTITTTVPAPARVGPPPARVKQLSAFATLSRRRFALSASTPRELLVPLLTPILFAVVIAPALAKMVGIGNGLDYKTYVAVGTVGLLVPLSCMFAGLGVIVDRDSGARRELLAAPIPRPLLVLGNLSVALVVSALQLVALMVSAILRGASFHVSTSGIAWFVAAALAFAVFSYGLAETLANRIPKQEEYIGAVPAFAILPWFLAGSLFPIKALPAGLAAFAKVLPLTHALAVMRYALVDPHGTGLHDIWGMSNPGAMAALSLIVVVAYAVVLTMVAIKVFNKAAVQ
jgi:ABC-type multidrug transport system permease subunit